MIAILILAAGASRRMQGRDKLMEEVDGIPLLQRQTMRAVATGCDVFVTLPDMPHPRYSALDPLNVTCVPVTDAALGMNASLRAGLSALPDPITAVMVLLADMPDLTSDDMKTVLHCVDTKGENLIWRATTQAGDAGHPIVFHRQLWSELIALEGDKGGSAVVQKYAGKTHLIALPDTHARTDLDTPQAWADWRARRRSI